MGLFSSLFGGKKKTKTTATTNATIDQDPYAPTIPYLNEYLGQVREQYATGDPFSEDELAGYQLLRDNIANYKPGANDAQSTGLAALISNLGIDPTTLSGIETIAANRGPNALTMAGVDSLGDAVNNPGVDNILTAMGLSDIAGLSADPTSYNSTARNTLERTAGGEFLTPETNPYIKDIATRVAGITGSNINSTFGGRGRTGSGLAGYYAGKGVNDSITDLYGQTYENERNRQQAASLAAPGFDAANLANATSVGTTKLNAGLNYGTASMDQGLKGAIAQLDAGRGITSDSLSAGQALVGAGNDVSARNMAAGQAIFDAGSKISDDDYTRNMNNAQALVSAGQIQSARPYELSTNYGNILSQIAKLGQQGATTGQTTQVNETRTNGLLGSIFNSFVNKLFGTTLGTSG